jgi:hypothetical protein
MMNDERGTMNLKTHCFQFIVPRSLFIIFFRRLSPAMRLPILRVNQFSKKLGAAGNSCNPSHIKVS